MRLDRTARTLLSVTALAWAIPLAHAGTDAASARAGMTPPSANSAEFDKLDTNRDGYLSRGEVRGTEMFSQSFDQADRDHDGRLSAGEAITAEQLHDRGSAARYAEDAWLTTKVKTALLREKGLDSMDISVETYRNEVLLSGFVADLGQKRKALLVASNVAGVKDVRDGLEIRR
ncbi:MAG TPA: BON domain-containing protein [Burkholderiales bacterium]|nr:BON domain-containing protein [Burkholderiales bacterium]